ncbi:MAG: ABC transporter permease, partial [Halocynthiibacter sp.]
MIPTIKQDRSIRLAYGAYIVLFFIYLGAPLVVVSVFAFNDTQFPSLPWKGFTWDWFFNPTEPKLGVFYERPIMGSIGISAFVAFWVTTISILIGTCN